MNLSTGYGRFAAAVNSLLIAILCPSAAHAQTAPKDRQIKLAILGDISRYTDRSESLKALVRESNRGRDVAFLPSLDTLIAIVG